MTPRPALPDDDLVHVGDVGVEERAALGRGENRDRAVAAFRGERRPVDRIDRDVHRRSVAGSDVLADVEHRSFVLLAFADDDDAVDVDLAENAAHRVDGGLIDGVLVAAPDQLAGDDRRSFGRPEKFQLDACVDPPPVHHAK